MPELVRYVSCNGLTPETARSTGTFGGVGKEGSDGFMDCRKWWTAGRSKGENFWRRSQGASGQPCGSIWAMIRRQDERWNPLTQPASLDLVWLYFFLDQVACPCVQRPISLKKKKDFVLWWTIADLQMFDTFILRAKKWHNYKAIIPWLIKPNLRH